MPTKTTYTIDSTVYNSHFISRRQRLSRIYLAIVHIALFVLILLIVQTLLDNHALASMQAHNLQVYHNSLGFQAVLHK